jgi:hypothetical protein
MILSLVSTWCGNFALSRGAPGSPGPNPAAANLAARDFALAIGKPYSMIEHRHRASRKSEVPGIYAKARPFLCAVLARLGR